MASTSPSARRTFWAWARPVGGAAVLGVVFWRVGTGPVLDGLRFLDGWSLAAALVIGAVTTVCTAWRWSLVAGGLGVRVPLAGAVLSCYRAVFLNATLPGGVLGDVDRAVRHGRDAGDLRRSVRAVIWERATGQAVQIAVTIVALLVLPSPVRPVMPLVAGIVLGATAVLVVVAATAGRVRWVRAVRADLRDGVLAHAPRILLASTVAVAGFVAMFLVAARTAGTTASIAQLVPLALLALIAMAVPANVGGFGPREGVAAWGFAAAGFASGDGVSAAVAFGALVLVSSLPGALVLLAQRMPRTVPAIWAGAVRG